MISGGIFSSLIGAGADVIGGLIGSAFAPDTPSRSYEKEYGEESRRLRFGQNIGRRLAMGDPTIDAYFQSKLKSDPKKAREFIDDFGADIGDYNPTRAYEAPIYQPSGGMVGSPMPSPVGSPMPSPVGGGMFSDERAADYSGDQEQLRRTLQRLSTPSRAGLEGGYSGSTQQSGLFY